MNAQLESIHGIAVAMQQCFHTRQSDEYGGTVWDTELTRLWWPQASLATPWLCPCQFVKESFSCSTFHYSPLQSCWTLTFSQTQPQPRTCTVPRPYLARVRAHIEVRAGLDWTGWLSVKQMVQYLDLLRWEQLPSHLLSEEVPPTVAMPVSQRRLLQTYTEKNRRKELG